MEGNQSVVGRAAQHLYPNYRQAPFALVRGAGCRLFDADGKSYLDLCAGVAVSSVGHGHPRLVGAIARQAAQLLHASNYFLNEPNVALAEALALRSGFDFAFFCNSGTEANEAMIKLSLRHFHAKGESIRKRFVGFHHAFHGRTLGSLSVTGTPKYREGFGSLVPVTHVHYGDLAETEAAMGPDVAAIMVEPLQGEGGVIPAPPGFLAGLRAIADRTGALLLVDEVQTGVGRLGRMFGFQGSGAVPDAISLAKGLGGGVPIGAMLTTRALGEALPPGTHGSTFGGNPLACSAALAVLEIIDQERLLENVAERGVELSNELQRIHEELPGLVEGHRGEGLLQGLVLAGRLTARDLLPALQGAGVLLTAAGDKVLRFTPPLTISQSEIREGARIVRDTLRALVA